MKTLNRLNKFLENRKTKINYVDVGAREDISNLWKKLEKSINVYGFETDPIELKRIKNKFPLRTYYEFGLWSEEKDLKLYITQDASSSSIYKPNSNENQNYKAKYHDCRILKKVVNVKCKKLDDLLTISPDFIKIDTQGSEFEIIKGARKLLTYNCPMVSLETWTRDVYKNSPRMDQIISLMYEYGYEILDMELCASEKHRTDLKTISKQTISGYEIIFGKKNIEMVKGYDTKVKYVLLLDLFGYKDMALYLNKKYINNSDLKLYLLTSSKVINNIIVLFKKSFKIISSRIIGEPYYKISD
jgi:FkbM family methyltransferase